MPFAWYRCWQSVWSPWCVSFTCASDCFPELPSPKLRCAPSEADKLGPRGAFPWLLQYDAKLWAACCSGGHLLVILGGSLGTKVHTSNSDGRTTAETPAVPGHCLPSLGRALSCTCIYACVCHEITSYPVWWRILHVFSYFFYLLPFLERGEKIDAFKNLSFYSQVKIHL